MFRIKWGRAIKREAPNVSREWWQHNICCVVLISMKEKEWGKNIGGTKRTNHPRGIVKWEERQNTNKEAEIERRAGKKDEDEKQPR